eukprot:Phypoly_transcript_09778.p1 GENE.Phypoly_transcript_09778~~Phypoly_transcript_09778.p1  ORF type:complete len:160 (+),score=25.58 Phypoly_transcript_09778:188-667(+)
MGEVRFKHSSEPIFTKDQIKAILSEADKMRLSNEIQDAFSEKDDIANFFAIMKEIYASIVRKLPVSDKEKALEEVFSVRAIYKGDKEMEEFMSSLIHVKYDLTGDGPIQQGDPMVDASLFGLDGSPTKLSSFLAPNNRPLVVIAGFWCYCHAGILVWPP